MRFLTLAFTAAVKVQKENTLLEWSEPGPRDSAPGSHVDEHGCRPSTGYTWCASTKKC